MVVLGIYGSPRKGGNTDLMLDAFLEGATSAGGEARRIHVRDMDLHGCLACGYCDKNGSCVQKDAMQEVYPLLEAAPRVVVSSPIYFYGVTGQLKLLIDRSQALYMKREIKRKEALTTAGALSVAPSVDVGSKRKGFLLSAGATRGKRLFECAILSVQYFFDAVAAEYSGEICLRELEEKGAILSRPEALEKCRQAGADFMAP